MHDCNQPQGLLVSLVPYKATQVRTPGLVNRRINEAIPPHMGCTCASVGLL